MSALSSLVTNKSIAIVGNAESVFSKENGKIIDEFDVVVRFNRGFITKPESQGSKTDILVLACTLSHEELKQYNAKQVIYRKPHFQNGPGLIFKKAFLNDLKRDLGYRASSGYMVIKYLLTFNVKTPINCFGFDFGETKTFYNRPEYVSPHNFKLEGERLLKTGKVKFNV